MKFGGDNPYPRVYKNHQQVVLIGDGGFFSVMPIVQKVVVSIRSLLPNGSLRVDAGLHPVCLAARQHAVPVIGLCPMHKVSFSHPMVS